MDELTKVRRVIAKQMPDAPHETLLTVDATTGQNGVRQAKLFGEAVAGRRDRPHQARRHRQGRHRAGDRRRARHPGQADRHRRAARGPAPVRRRRFRPRAAGRPRAIDDCRALVTDRAPGDLDSPDMDAWVIWLIAAVFAAVGEIADHGLLPRAVRGRRAGRRDARGRWPAAAARSRSSSSRSLTLACFALRAADRRAPPAHAARRSAPAPRRSSAQTAIVLERIANDEGVGSRAPRRRGLDRARLRRGRASSRRARASQVVEIRGATALVRHDHGRPPIMEVSPWPH